jgi:hypothetical protein
MFARQILHSVRPAPRLVAREMARKPSPYNQFVKDNMLAMRKEKPDAKVTELMKEIAKKVSSSFCVRARCARMGAPSHLSQRGQSGLLHSCA